jgi:hypothetical protein
MEKALEALSASALRNLLIEEVKVFIMALENSSPDELQAMKDRLRSIYQVISEKEQAETKRPDWGENSTPTPGNGSHGDFLDNLVKNLRTD